MLCDFLCPPDRGNIAHKLTLNSGTFSSPVGSDGQYPSGLKCAWSLTVQPIHVIQLTFSKFELEQSLNCEDGDYVIVYNGESSRNDPLATICGENAKPIFSTTSKMIVEFISNDKIERSGFTANFKTVDQSAAACASGRGPLNLTDTKGSIKSPGYDGNSIYPPNIMCQWVIKANEGMEIDLTADRFALEESRGCHHDHVDIFDGSEPVLSKLLGKYCGIHAHVELDHAPASNMMLITFISNKNVGGLGFRFRYSVYPRVASRSNQNGAKTLLNLPGCGLPAIRDETGINPYILIDGSIEATPHSWPWTVMIVDSSGSANAQICGGTLVRNNWVITAAYCIRSTSPYSLKVRLGEHSQTDYNDGGYVANVAEIMKHPNASDGYDIAMLRLVEPQQLTDNVQTACIVHEDVSGGHGYNCVVTAWSSRTYFDRPNPPVALKKVGFQIRPRKECYRHYSYFNDTMICAGYMEDRCHYNEFIGSPMVCQLSSTPSAPWFLTGIVNYIYCANADRRPGVFIRIANEEIQNWIIELIDKPVPTADPNDPCLNRIELTESTGVIKTNGYPYNYAINLQCRWLIRGSVNQNVRLEFTDLKMEDAVNCEYDNVSLFSSDAPDEARKLGTFCGVWVAPSVYTSTGSNMFILFNSDDSVTKSGFRAEYTLITNGASPTSGPTQLPSGQCGSPAITPYLPNTVGGSDDAANNVVNGDNDVPHSWPWHVMLTSMFGNQFCGGSLLNEYWVITAADCLSRYREDQVLVRVGAHDKDATEPSQRSYTVNRFVTHPQARDIALWRLDEPVEMSDEVSPVCLPETGDVPTGTYCMISGWGSGFNVWQVDFSERTLQQADLPIISTQVCNQHGMHSGTITPRMMCAGYIERGAPGFCRGDRGGPLVCRYPNSSWELYGIVSWEVDCNSVLTPGVFVRVYYYMDWIKQRLALPALPPLPKACSFQVIVSEAGDLVFPQYYDSPNEDDMYRNQLTCVWLIQAPPGEGVIFNITSISIEYYPSYGRCTHDFLYLYDGSSDQNTRVGKFCGSSPPGTTTSTGRSMFVVFKSGPLRGGRGFKASISFTGQTGTTAAPVTQPQVTDPPATESQVINPQVEQCGIGIMPNGRIVGGSDAVPYSWPWMAMLTTDWGYQFCGATLIDTNWVLTAAHCTSGMDPWDMVIRLGEYSKTKCELLTQVIPVIQIINHPGYDPETTNNDISLLRLGKPAELNGYVGKACLPAAEPEPGRQCVVTGWGTTEEEGSSSDKLKEVHVPIISRTTCNLQYNGSITDQMICAGELQEGGKDSCQGDSGGPLVCKEESNAWSVYGVVSWGSGCARVGKPGVYANVAQYLTWIDDSKETQAPAPEPELPPECTGSPVQLSGATGIFTSPNYGRFDYPHNATCTYVITSPPGTVVQLEFKEFDVEPYPECIADYVTIIDETARSTHKLCGAGEMGVFASTSNTLTVELSTDNSVRHPGFTAVYTATEIGCSVQAQPSITHTPGTLTPSDCGVPFISPNIQPRIVGGDIAKPNSWPWQVMLTSTTSPSNQFCGGSLISPYWVLTAAHCTDGSETNVVVGAHDKLASDSQEDGRQIIQVVDVIDHPSYNESTFNNDISLLHLAMPATLGDKVGLVCLPTIEPVNDDWTYTTGWGATSAGGPASNQLRQVMVKIIGRQNCRTMYSTHEITDNMICAGYEGGGKDSCQGDSGGPLVTPIGEYGQSGWRLSGVTSWGQGCASPNKPGVYTNVIKFVDWIRGIVADLPSGTTSQPTTQPTTSTSQPTISTPQSTSTTTQPSAQPSNRECGQPALPPIVTKVVGGVPAKPHSWPWQAMLVSPSSGDYICGGTLIDPNWVVTSAICTFWMNIMNIRVRLGEHHRFSTDGKERNVNVTQIIPHDDFEPGGNDNDISLLRLAETITHTDEISPVCLPSDGASDGKYCTVTGWGPHDGSGWNLSTVLRQVEVPIVSTNICNGNQTYNGLITENMLCAGEPREGKDFCMTDRGGPLVCTVGDTLTYELQGIVSWGSCAFGNIPSVYTRVTRYLTWLKEMVNSTITDTARTTTMKPTNCGSMLTSDEGEIKSPNWPGKYPDWQDCHWFIELEDPSMAVELTFTVFDLEYIERCLFDNVKLIDGVDGTSLSEALCGQLNDLPQVTYYSNSHKLEVIFTSDSSINGLGFLANFQSVQELTTTTTVPTPAPTPVLECGNPLHLNGTTGEFNSPNFYNGGYDNNEYCSWMIDAPEGMNVQLTFNTFDLEYIDDCSFDYVKLTDEEGTIGEFCGSTIPDPIISIGHWIGVEFRSDNTIKGKGFQASYAVIEERSLSSRTKPTVDPCERTLVIRNAGSGYVTSPGYDAGENYDPDITCKWRIMAPDDMVVSLYVEVMDMECHKTCRYDKLLVYDSNNNANKLDMICCNDSGGEYTTTQNNMFIELKTDASTQASGFKLHYWTHIAVRKALASDFTKDECGVTHVNETHSKITEAVSATPHSWPWTVSLRLNGDHTCGGSLISENWVITAAQCMAHALDPEDWSASLGEHKRSDNSDGQITQDIEVIVTHPDYDGDVSNENDIALVRLGGSVKLGPYIAPICLPEHGKDLYAVIEEQGDSENLHDCTTVGWGVQGINGGLSDVLQQVKVPIVSQDECNSANAYSGEITRSMVCAGYSTVEGTCQGDFGGPLMCRDSPDSNYWSLVGVRSFGEGCASPNHPGVYTRVASYKYWITNTMDTVDDKLNNKKSSVENRERDDADVEDESEDEIL
ncbi:unnamed protein product [Owenia fusiformis]|uniref:Uncharacterized protein n=1 Tax=Owenia fusiformis TaxID=6347 RepID=A0A8S4PZD8_OWEFU|nr:unnamed protein product [Owenia fusiformis]